jgi:hypothetical protein
MGVKHLSLIPAFLSFWFKAYPKPYFNYLKLMPNLKMLKLMPKLNFDLKNSELIPKLSLNTFKCYVSNNFEIGSLRNMAERLILTRDCES